MSLDKKFCLVIFSLIGLTNIVAEECEHGKHYQNLSDRRKFLYCSHGQIHDLSCSEGFYWNANINSCDFQSNVICPAVIPPAIPMRTTPTISTSTTTTPPLIACKDFCGHSTGLHQICPQFDLGMQWSSSGTISGMNCTHIVETADPFTWHDNFLCFNNEYGIRWSSAGPIDGMNCAQIIEPGDPYTWNDNFLCVPYGSPFQFKWSYHNSIPGLCCVHMNEPSDPHTWNDNYLCVSE